MGSGPVFFAGRGFEELEVLVSLFCVVDLELAIEQGDGPIGFVVHDHRQQIEQFGGNRTQPTGAGVGFAIHPDLDRVLVLESMAEYFELELSDRTQDRLASADPEAAAKIAPTDPQRTARALEVLEATGKPISHWQQQRGRRFLTGRARGSCSIRTGLGFGRGSTGVSIR